MILKKKVQIVGQSSRIKDKNLIEKWLKVINSSYYSEEWNWKELVAKEIYKSIEEKQLYSSKLCIYAETMEELFGFENFTGEIIRKRIIEELMEELCLDDISAMDIKLKLNFKSY